MTEIAVIVPVLARPERALPLVESLAASANHHQIRAVFVCTPGDDAQIEAARATEELETGAQTLVVDWLAGHGDYARKINHAFRVLAHAGVEWMLLGADDLRFHEGWAEEALAVARRTKCCVIGTNDYGNPTVKRGQHATHSLVHRDYLECGTVDEHNLILCESYSHNFVDNEFVETARRRRTFAFAARSIVEHMHPVWRKGEWDSTYEKGQRDFDEDRLLWHRRRQAVERL